jgi:hypothetical protein
MHLKCIRFTPNPLQLVTKGWPNALIEAEDIFSSTKFTICVAVPIRVTRPSNMWRSICPAHRVFIPEKGMLLKLSVARRIH